VIVGVGANPPAPESAVRDSDFESETSIQVTWTAVSASDLPITGYVLEMDDGFLGDFTEIYDGRENTQVLDHEVFGLEPQMIYRFRVVAIDVNGPGSYSLEVSLQACTPPSSIASPLIVEISKESFIMSWAAPTILGGCPITDYELLRDDGEGSDVDIPIETASVASRPDLYEYTVVLDSSFTGKYINVKVTAINAMGSITSKSTLLVLADVPSKPFPAPIVDQAETTISQIKVSFENSNTDDGGSPITKLELWMDDGYQGEFKLILVTNSRTSFVVSSGIERGLTYRFKYQVGNVNGWSEFSDISYIFAYSAPERPPAPPYVSGTDTTVTLAFLPSRNDHGIRVASYELYIDVGDDTTSSFR
jgi:hypothetical protein